MISIVSRYAVTEFSLLHVREKHTETKKNLFTMTSQGFVTAEKNNSLIDRKEKLFRAYLVTILKAII